MHPTEFAEVMNHLKEAEEQSSFLPQNSKVENIENALIEFIIKERIPISKTESIHLNKLLNGNFCILAF